MERADYSFELSKNPKTFLNIDKAWIGVGGTNSWSRNSLPLPVYRIPNESLSYQYRITPVF
ncbi:hypothetical protein DN748_15495 [Sinomicrobium soli]|nr:hypothetical protein DN748_15495 [Sinomicrobium sp. N-1-3-6]